MCSASWIHYWSDFDDFGLQMTVEKLCSFIQEIEVFKMLNCKKCNYFFHQSLSLTSDGYLKPIDSLSIHRDIFWFPLVLNWRFLYFHTLGVVFFYKYQRVDDRWAMCWHYIWLFISFEKQPRFNLKSIAFDTFLDISDTSLHISIFTWPKNIVFGQVFFSSASLCLCVCTSTISKRSWLILIKIGRMNDWQW